MNLSISLLAQLASFTIGAAGIFSGWKDQKLRSWAVIIRPVVAFTGAFDSGQAAPDLIHWFSASISCGWSFPPFGIFKSPLCRTDRINKLASGSPGTIAGPI